MQEKELQLMSGFLAVFFHFIYSILMLPLMLFWPVVGIIMVPIASVLWFVCLFGYIVNSPNQARVVQFFGSMSAPFARPVFLGVLFTGRLMSRFAVEPSRQDRPAPTR
jgi:hypothetical protein